MGHSVVAKDVALVIPEGEGEPHVIAGDDGVERKDISDHWKEMLWRGGWAGEDGGREGETETVGMHLKSPGPHKTRLGLDVPRAGQRWSQWLP